MNKHSSFAGTPTFPMADREMFTVSVPLTLSLFLWLSTATYSQTGMF